MFRGILAVIYARLASYCDDRSQRALQEHRDADASVWSNRAKRWEARHDAVLKRGGRS
jgi:hypothetical protein